MPKLRIVNKDCELTFNEGKSIMEVLVENSVYINNACNGNGTCGKCRVKSEGKYILSCESFPEKDMEIEVPEEEKNYRALTSGYVPEFELDASADICDEKNKYGVAVDIGTTTVAASLIDMKSGSEVAEASSINPQRIYGLDVLTRISYEANNPKDGIGKLQGLIIDELNSMIAAMCENAQISRESIIEIAVAANCTMLHMLLGVDASSIGVAPYIPAFTSARTMAASDVGLKLANARLYCLPSVSGYIGADVVAGAYACGLEKADKSILFIDIGTNGEMVLSKHGKMLSCSCAAGPAFEGMNITCGMRAVNGAIEDVHISENGIKLEVIGEASPEGICGSGILATLRELLSCGFLKSNGTFIKKEELSPNDYRFNMLHMNGKKREFVLCGGKEALMVTQSDIRQLQLAKAAISSGIKALLSASEMNVEEIDELVIAGQFGAHLPVSSLTGTGIIPQELQGKVKYVGNSSKTGAYMALMSAAARADMEALAAKIKYIELSGLEAYERIFTESINF